LKNCETILKYKAKKIKIDVPTRWNSIYVMLKSLLKNKIAVVALICEGSKKFKERILSEEEWRQIAVL